MNVTTGKFPTLHTTDLVGANSSIRHGFGVGVKVEVGQRRATVEDAVSDQIRVLESRGYKVRIAPGGYVTTDRR